MLFATPELLPEEQQVVDQIDELRGQLRFVTRQRRRWSGTLRRNTFARAIQASNSIEGHNVTQEDAEAIVMDEPPLQADDADIAAVKGYRDAMTFVLQQADAPTFQYNENLLLGLHFMMMRHDMARNPGRWRPGFVYITHEPTGDTVYEGPDIEIVPGLLQELIEALNAASPQPALVRAAMAHLNLVMIHPFSDGNGRMSRCLQTLILAREGVLEPEFCSIEEYLGRNTLDYYRVLAEVGAGAWNPQRDARPWVRFCLTAHYRQAMTLLRRTREYERLWHDVENVARQHGLHDRTMEPLFDAARGFPLTNSYYRNAAGVSEVVAGRDLKALADAGLLTARGEKRGRFYRAGAILKEIRTKTRETRVINEDPFATARA